MHYLALATDYDGTLALVRRADLVTTGARGQGTTELCDRMIASDLAGVERRTKIGPAVTR